MTELMTQVTLDQGQTTGGRAESIVVFDFDGTLYSEDSFAAFIRWRIFSSWWRTLLAFGVLPIAVALRFLPAGRCRYASSFLWAASLGQGLEQLEEQMAVYVYRNSLMKQGYFYSEAIDCLREHIAAGRRVVVATGAAEPLVRLLLHSQRVDGVLLFGSRLQQAWGGVLCRYHCYGENKQAALRAVFPNTRYEYVYSDSLADLPVLSHADRVVLVNFDAKSLAYVEKGKSHLFAQARSICSVKWV